MYMTGAEGRLHSSIIQLEKIKRQRFLITYYHGPWKETRKRYLSSGHIIYYDQQQNTYREGGAKTYKSKEPAFS